MAVSRARINLELAVMGFDYTTIADDDVADQRATYLLKNHDTVTGAAGSGVLTSDATAPSDADTVTVGTVVYTYKTALTGVRPTTTLTSDATAPSDGDQVTLGDRRYTYKTTLTGAANEVLIGASAAIALDNIKIAINDSGGTRGVEYGLGTTAHTTIEATTNANTTQVFQSKSPGTVGNSYATVETSSHLSFTGTTLAGGVAAVPFEVIIGASAAAALDNLKAAINATGTGETEYGSGTTAHPLVTATTNTDTAQTVVPRFKAITLSIATTETSSHLSWGSAAVTSGLPGMIAVPAAEAQRVAGGQAV